jgi:hypothetical protein
MDEKQRVLAWIIHYGFLKVNDGEDAFKASFSPKD